MISSGEKDHYLKTELYQLLADDPDIFDWIQKGSLDGIWYLDLENPEEEWYSDEFKRCFGYEPHEIPNKSSWWQENIHEDDLKGPVDAWHRHVADASFPYDQLVRYWHKDGSLVWVRCRGIAIRDENGKALRFLGAHTDVTALARAQARYELLGDKLTDGVWEWNIQTGKLILSPRFEEVLGYTPGELKLHIDVWIETLLHPDDAHLGWAALNEHFEKGAPYNIELRYKHKQGHYLWLRTAGSVIERTREGEPLVMVGIHTNVTELRNSNVSLTASNSSLVQANDDLKDFAYVVSHDLQEPLRMISSYVSLFERKYSGSVDQRAEKYIKYITEGTERLSTLLDDLLRFSRIDTTDEEFTKVDLGKVLGGVLDDLSVLLEERNVKVTTAPLPLAQGRKSHFRLIFQNLIANAVKFSSENPEIRVSYRVDGAFSVVGVHDNGIGIAPEHHEKIFDIFSRLHTRNEYPGTGMGLAIVKRAIEKNGGTVWIESQLGLGSNFFISLPRTEKHDTED